MFLLLFCHHWLSFKLSGVGLDLEPKMIESANVVTQIKDSEVYQMLCKTGTNLNLSLYMDYDNDSNSQTISICTQLNGHGRISADIGCSLM